MPQVGKFKGLLKLKVRIKAKTGLHIGGAKENVEIGGIDNIVEKLKIYRTEKEINGKREFREVPYIPGSSLKGKLRSLLEWVEHPFNQQGQRESQVIALTYKGHPCKCGKCMICKLFGGHQASGKEPVRLRFDDFYPTDDTIEMWENTLEGVYTEIKVENTIDRISSRSSNLRHTERVIAGSEFEGYITCRIFEGDSYEDFFKLIKTGLEMLEDDYLGGSGSRGYGRVEIRIEDIEYKAVENGEYKKKDQDNVINKAKEVFAELINKEVKNVSA